MSGRRNFSLEDFPERYQQQIREQLGEQGATAPRGRPEASFQEKVIAVARALGWRVFHARAVKQANGDYRTPVFGADGKGFPDLVLAKAGTVLFVELKSGRGTLRPNQREWKRDLEPSGLYRLWHPHDWPEIEATLLQEAPDAD